MNLIQEIKSKLEEESSKNLKIYKSVDKHMDDALKSVKRSMKEIKKLSPRDDMAERIHKEAIDSIEQMKRMVIKE